MKYVVYYIHKNTHRADFIVTESLTLGLRECENLRKQGMLFVTMVSDYHNMVGPSGASWPDASYTPQTL